MSTCAQTLARSDVGALSPETQLRSQKKGTSLLDGLLPVVLLAGVFASSISNAPPTGLAWAVAFLSALVLAGGLLVGGRPGLTYVLPILLASEYVVLSAFCPSIRVSASVSLSLPVVFLLLPILFAVVRPRAWNGLPGFPSMLIALAGFFFLVLTPLVSFRFGLLALALDGWVAFAAVLCLAALFRGSAASSFPRIAVAVCALLMLVVALFRAVGLP